MLFYDSEAGSLHPLFIDIDTFMTLYGETHPDIKTEMLRARLHEAMLIVQHGLTCDCCGRPIWVVGTALFGWRGCYVCMEGRNSAPFLELSENINMVMTNSSLVKYREQVLVAAARLPAPTPSA